MPKCLYYKKVFINQQALGNHIKKHLDDSNEDLSLPNKVIHTNLVEITNRVLNDQNKLESQNLFVKKDMNYKQHCFKYNLDNSLGEINFNVNSFVENQNPSILSFNYINDIRNYESQDIEFFNYNDFQSNTSDRSIEKQVIELFDQSDSQSNDYSDSQSNDHSDSQSNDHSNSQSNDHSDSQSNTSDVQSDLLDITDVDFNEYAEYDDLYSGKSKGPEDIYQEFLLEYMLKFRTVLIGYTNS
ncbi:5237_t:CDS:2 [Cetraspora pellucida]|uniref:5237_t:CDS:1 n=1 Tax=Cetraspora pellucida TaxID=1433469 RepID=A0A9N9I6X1_9GLOM|nr:5237_t:CDS:2 [Cetraspora pellucida]